jgi:serine O-acetyltransferase
MATDLSLRSRIPQLTDRIVDSYRHLNAINHLGHCPLPSSTVVIEIAEKLKEIIFPGYRRRQNLNMENVVYYVGDLIDSLHDQLTEQISRALRYGADVSNETCDKDRGSLDFEMLAQEKAIQFLETLPDIRTALASDVQAAHDGDPASKAPDEIIFCYPGIEAITIYRIAHELTRLDVPLIPRMLAEWSHSRTGIDIHPGATIGHSFFIDHGTGVVIGETCEIAENVKLYQGVTLGAISFPRDKDGNIIRGKKRHPTIEAGVVIYSNATVLGGETVIGENSMIGASVSILNKKIAPNTVVTVEKPNLRYREAS